MRTFFVFLFLAIFFVITFPFYLILLLLRKKNRHLSSVIAQKFVRFGFWFVTQPTGMKKIVLGTENIPMDTPVLYVSNHRSLVDIPMAYMTVPNLTGFVAKIEIKKAPFLSWWMVLVNCLFLDRSDMRAGMKMILDGIDNIKQGYSVFIAPEGTRSRTNEMLPFKEGSLKIADKTNCPIIPVAISGTDDVFENSFPWVKKATTVIEYGTPIYPEQLSKEDRKAMGAYCRDIIADMLKGHEQYLPNNRSYRNK